MHIWWYKNDSVLCLPADRTLCQAVQRGHGYNYFTRFKQLNVKFDKLHPSPDFNLCGKLFIFSASTCLQPLNSPCLSLPSFFITSAWPTSRGDVLNTSHRVVPTNYMINLRHLPAQFSIFSQVCYEMRYPGKLNEIYLISCHRHFIFLSGIFHFLPCTHFIACPWVFHIQLVTFFITCQVWFLSFHSLLWGISYPPCWIFHCLPGVIYLSISFLALGHFIATSLHFSLYARCNLFIYFIPCPGPFYSHAVGFYIACQVQFIYAFHSLPWAISYQPCWIFHYLPGVIFYPFHSLPWAISYPHKITMMIHVRVHPMVGMVVTWPIS